MVRNTSVSGSPVPALGARYPERRYLTVDPVTTQQTMSEIETGFRALATVMRSIADVEQPLDTKIRSVLETAADTLGFPIAYFTYIDDRSQRIVATVGDHDDIYAGAVDPLEETYCRKTIAADEPLVVADAESEGWAEDPAYEKFGLSCYLGAPVTVTVAGETYGTICTQTAAPATITADERLDVALGELIENAVVHNDQPEPTVTVTVDPETQSDGEWVDIVVADDGPGIPTHEQVMIESGRETPLEHGSGLALWIVYWTASLFGGEIMIEDRSPRGARVTLRLPQATDV